MGRGRVSVNTEKNQNLAIKILQYNHGRPFSLSFGKQSWDDYSSAQWALPLKCQQKRKTTANDMVQHDLLVSK